MEIYTKLKRPFTLLLSVVMVVGIATAQNKQEEKVQKSTDILIEFSKMKEAIPEQLMEQSQGIIIIPNLINAGLGVGGKRGKGIAMVKHTDGSWSDPVFVTLTGGSIGFQAGVQSIDLVLLFRKRSTLISINKGTFTLGGGASVAAGPVGRSASATTDYKLDAEVYSYSRSKGLFAGISLDGTAIDIDSESNSVFYGENAGTEAIFSGSSKASSKTSITTLKQTLKEMY